MRERDIARFWGKVDKSGDCWLWTAKLRSDGYAHFRVGRAMIYAHRFSYELLSGPIPKGLSLDHRCLVRHCVNPSHLRPATHKQNMENHNGAYANNKSGVRGVTWHKQRNKWVAKVGHNGKVLHVGLFDTVAAAETAVVAKRNELFTHNDMDRVSV